MEGYVHTMRNLLVLMDLTMEERALIEKIL